MRVAVVGCGYVGLVSAVGLATIGHDVVGIDADAERVETLARGETPFHEPGLAASLGAVVESGRFVVSGSLAEAVSADVVLLCVQTPPLEGGDVELRFLEDAAERLASVLAEDARRRRVVAIRSTVPPGTNERSVAPLLAREEIAVVSNPEFLREGSALDDFLHADRVVVGVRESWAAETMTELYAPLATDLIVTSPATAELAKYTSNAFLATLVSFSNEIGRLCEATPGVDVEDVLGILHRDRRLQAGAAGPPATAAIVSYLKAGCGFGGSCLPKDLSALISYAHRIGEPAELLRAVDAVNRGQSTRLVVQVERRLGSLEGRKIAVLGAAFKAGTDDLRDSPGLRVVAELLARGATVSVYDPLVAPERLRAALPASGADVAASLDEATRGVAACVVTTLEPEFGAVANLVSSANGNSPIVVDGRRALDPGDFAARRYLGVGRADEWS